MESLLFSENIFLQNMASMREEGKKPKQNQTNRKPSTKESPPKNLLQTAKCTPCT